MSIPDDNLAYIPDRKPTIHEAASNNYIGVLEQRPVELLKLEMQSDKSARRNFYQYNSPIKSNNLPRLKKINDFLKYIPPGQ